MALSKQYRPQETEPRLQARWRLASIYKFERQATGPVYAIDTPPATVSGKLHMGHVYSYSHADFIARFWRMNGQRVFYPMGYDDNGLPTERLVEKRLGIRANEIGREEFINQCLRVSLATEREYESLWIRLGLSVDWSHTYRTIGRAARRIAQKSFIDLFEKGLAYRKKAPAVWCPECQTAIAQAELDEADRMGELVTIDFRLSDGNPIPIATTRPELLAACVAIFVHPSDDRYSSFIGHDVTVPLYGHEVSIMQDKGADPEMGTGAVMCCTFGDAADVAWWHSHHLPLVSVIDGNGRLNRGSGDLNGLSVPEARRHIVRTLDDRGLIRDRRPFPQSVRVHERCDTPVEFIVAPQWFINILDFKDRWLSAGEEISWHPPHLKTRYIEWIENLHWDWCISRQRNFGVPFPIWYCKACGNVKVAPEQKLPIDPLQSSPDVNCNCGADDWVAETDVMDTWATSSLSPQIAARWQSNNELYRNVYPMSMRPQSHEIIRTWAFYTIVRSHYHCGQVPWKEVCVSGWGLAPDGAGKISKSRGGGPTAPMAAISKYSADAVRYWAAGTGFGKDTVISEERIQAGGKLINKLWNVARFSERFLQGYRDSIESSSLTPADRWILARTQRVIKQTTCSFRNYQYAQARHAVEILFWRDVADNYLEMAKQRLYADAEGATSGAKYALCHVLRTCVHLFAPFLPHVTDEIYAGLFAKRGESIHTSTWPSVDVRLVDDVAEAHGNRLVEIATAVRRFKSESNLPLSAPVHLLQLSVKDHALSMSLKEAEADMTSITRADKLDVRLNHPVDAGLRGVLESDAVYAAVDV